jgi:hypothetical protein
MPIKVGFTNSITRSYIKENIPSSTTNVTGNEIEIDGLFYNYSLIMQALEAEEAGVGDLIN